MGKAELNRFRKAGYQDAADAISRLDIKQTDREAVAIALTEAFRGKPNFMPDLFRHIASDPLVMCAGSDYGPCPDATEIRIAMHYSEGPLGRSDAWRQKKPETRCVPCGAKQFIPGYAEAVLDK